MGSITCWYGFSIKMFGMWTSNYDSKKAGRKKYKGNPETRVIKTMLENTCKEER